MMTKDGENNYEMEIKIKTFKYVALWKIVEKLSKTLLLFQWTPIET